MSPAPAIVASRFCRDRLRSSSEMRRHPQAVVTFVVAGEMVVAHGGSHVLRSGDVHLIPGGAQHRVVSFRDIDLWCLSLSPGALDPSRFAELLAPLDEVAQGAIPRVAIPDTRRTFVASLFAELASRPATGAVVRAESLASLLLAEIGDHRSPISAPHGASDLTAQALSFIARHAFGPLTLADVARGLGRDRAHLARVMRRETGRSVGEWIAEVRLEEARRRLVETTEWIDVIAERVGYTDATHFTRMFQRRFGIGPRAFRRQAPSP